MVMAPKPGKLGVDESSLMKRLAARMGPTVWELEGPMPILKSSKRLVFMRCVAAFRPEGYCRREGGSLGLGVRRSGRFENFRRRFAGVERGLGMGSDFADDVWLGDIFF